MKDTRAEANWLRDRLAIAIRTLRAAGVPVDAETVLIGAGLDLHHDRKRVERMIPHLCRGAENIGQ